MQQILIVDVVVASRCSIRWRLVLSVVLTYGKRNTPHIA